MRSFTWFPVGILALVVATASPAQAATVAGTVMGPDSAPFRGAFVQARNAKTRITVSVLSDPQGRYLIENLPAGDYRLIAARLDGEGEVPTQRTEAPKAEEETAPEQD